MQKIFTSFILKFCRFMHTQLRLQGSLSFFNKFLSFSDNFFSLSLFFCPSFLHDFMFFSWCVNDGPTEGRGNLVLLPLG
jgi:hypothetical protein